MEPIVETATIEDVEPRAQLRVALWPQDSLEDHRAELVRSLLSGHGQAVAFIARNDANETIGFAAATLRVVFFRKLLQFDIASQRRQATGCDR
jgi:aminoglycoside 6'-N-acetyltransferase I